MNKTVRPLLIPAVFMVVPTFLAALLLYGRPLLFPVLSQDDFQILAQSWTWQKTLDGLWAPNNEHAMPLGRLLTFVVAQLAGQPTALPLAGVLTGVVGLFAVMALTYRFVRRELGHPFYGVTALILFGVTSVYQQAIYWFAASFSVFALAFLLLALLAAQNYHKTGRLRWLLACVVWCALAPCWFAIGVLAGPFCCLYLLAPDRGAASDRPSRDRQGAGWAPPAPLRSRLGRSRLGRSRLGRPLAALLRLAPLLGTVAFLAVMLPLEAATIQNLEHYRMQGTTALQAFQPLMGAWYTVRSMVDNLALGAVGVCGVTVGPYLAPPLLALLLAAGGWWIWRSPRRRLALLGVGVLLGSYWLIYSGRAAWGYDRVGMVTPTWSRYHLQPQLGLVLILCGGLPAWEGRWFHLDATGRLTSGQVRALAGLLGLCLLIQAPRGVFGYYPVNSRQEQTLRRIERVSAYCRDHHISADAARRELGVLAMPESATVVNGWEFLRGSDEPQTPSPEEIRELRETAR